MSKGDKRPDFVNHHEVFGKVKKTITRTFRISAEWDEFLRKEAERRGISVNVLVNLILRRHAHIGRLAQADNLICLTKTSFHKIIEGTPSEYLSRAGNDTSSKDFPSILSMLGLPLDHDSFAYLVSRHFGGPNCAMWFCCYRHTLKNIDIFHLQQNLGRSARTRNSGHNRRNSSSRRAHCASAQKTVDMLEMHKPISPFFSLAIGNHKSNMKERGGEKDSEREKQLQ